MQALREAESLTAESFAPSAQNGDQSVAPTTAV
jgi:hypothetical protein